MEKYQLRHFFHELILIALKHPGKPGWGNPCSRLIESLVMRPDLFAKKIYGDYTYEGHEYRLNNAGLKLYWRVDRERRFSCRIGGDQAKDYLEFTAKGNRLINDLKYSM